MVKLSCILVILALTVLTLPQNGLSKNILVWSAIGSHSIRLSMWPLLEALVEKGHEVTYLSPWEDFESNSSKIQTYVPQKWKEAMGSSWDSEENTFFNDRKKILGIPRVWYSIRDLGVLSCELMYTDPEFQEWVKSSPKYDLVVVEMLVNECAYGLAHLWNSKVVIYSTTSVIPGFYDAHGLPDESSSISDITFGFPSGNEISFFQRVVNALNPILYSITKEHLYLPQLEEITRKGWKAMGLDKEVPSFTEVEKNTSLVLLTTHFSFEYARALPPNVVSIGGGVVAKAKKPMPKEMESFLNSAKDGFIYISFGTVAEFTHFDMSAQVEFVNAIRKFPKIKFLWKSSNPIKVALPDNVLVTKWAPQQTVMAHPNIKAFISHSGMGGTVEGIHFSVPLILMPILAEQDNNAQAIASKGAGIKLEVTTLTKEQLEHAISEILYNSKYKNAMKRLTEIYNDRPSEPVKDGVWWIEYILRHDNVHEFLASPSLNQPWWKRRQIDVWLTASLFLLIAISIPLYILYAIMKRLFGLSALDTSVDIGTKSKLKRN